jgi:hypothetical protein
MEPLIEAAAREREGGWINQPPIKLDAVFRMGVRP